MSEQPIAVARAESALGEILVAATGSGLCAAWFADEEAPAIVAALALADDPAPGTAATAIVADSLDREPSLRAECAAPTIAEEAIKVDVAASRAALLAAAGAEEIVELIDGRRRQLTVAIDERLLRGWQGELRRLLCATVSGDRVSYGMLAAITGRPGQARAVARACATNPLLIAIPCHRVLRADGSLGGYRAGPERKRALLAGEAERARDPLPTPSGR